MGHYGYNLPRNANIPEDVWKRNLDWVIREFKPHGFDTICTDGWIESSQRVNRNGYIISQNDAWKHDFAYWVRYLAARDMKLSMYYNPFWITQSARTDRAIKVRGRPDVAVADLTAPWDPFTKDKLYWVDPHRDGAKEYVQGYVKHFKDLGAVRLRVDFLSWFETGFDQNLGVIQREHGRDSYELMLRWIDEAAGTDMEVSLVMPNMFHHGELERPRGDSFRINDDADTGGDFLLASSFKTDAERRTAVSLMAMAGSPICIADTVDTIKNNAWGLSEPGTHRPQSGRPRRKTVVRQQPRLQLGHHVTGHRTLDRTTHRRLLDRGPLQPQ